MDDVGWRRSAGDDRVVVVGAGPGGLAVAMLLAGQGVEVVVVERDRVVGGRTRTLETPEGFRFDLGPTLFLYPKVLREIFAACGLDLDEHVRLTRLDPHYRLVFEGGGGGVLDATPDPGRMKAAIARLSQKDAAAFDAFMSANRAKLGAFEPALQRPFDNLFAMLGRDVLRALPLLRPARSVQQDLADYFEDPRVRQAFSFQTKYLGMSPWDCPSLFTILSFLEYEHGVFHPEGGCGALTAAMATACERLGVRFRMADAVEKIVFEDDRVAGVVTAGAFERAGAVVLNADFAHAVPRLVPERYRRGWSNRRVATARYSCSTFMMFLGLDGEEPALAHHNVLLTENYEANLREINEGRLPGCPSAYACHPGATDPTMAPAGASALYVLVPVPNRRAGIDWAAEAPAFRQRVLRRLERLGLRDVERRLRYERIVTPDDWDREFAVGHGATFNLAHDFGQMLSFRPRNRFSKAGIHLVGGGTHPGSGLPVIFEGARIAARQVLEAKEARSRSRRTDGPLLPPLPSPQPAGVAHAGTARPPWSLGRLARLGGRRGGDG
jgi:phytoene desaturase